MVLHLLVVLEKDYCFLFILGDFTVFLEIMHCILDYVKCCTYAVSMLVQMFTFYVLFSFFLFFSHRAFSEIECQNSQDAKTFHPRVTRICLWNKIDNYALTLVLQDQYPSPRHMVQQLSFFSMLIIVMIDQLYEFYLLNPIKAMFSSIPQCSVFSCCCIPRLPLPIVHPTSNT